MQEVIDRLTQIQAEQVKLLTKQEQTKELLAKHSNLLEKVRDELVEQNEILITNTHVLDEHHKRSNHLEKLVEQEKQKMEQIKEKVNKIEGIGLFIKWGGLTGAFILSGIKLMEWFSGM